uniref:alpha/beta fold hydrolase n=1 Tax=Deinococcus sp. TaxID=47478 RepID=UPI0028698888
ALYAQPPTDSAELLVTSHSPTLIVAGRHDRNVPLALLDEMAAALPDAPLQVFEDSAHFPDTEQTAAYATAVPAFLDDHPSNAR